jgi:uncharacterized membrane protein YesL
MSARRRPNDGLFEFLDKAGTFVLANLLFVVFAIPIITLPLAIAGIFAVMMLWARGKSVETFHSFFGAMRQHWRKAMVVGLIDLLLGGLVVLNFSIFRLMEMAQALTLISQSVTLFVGVTTIMVNLYAWPLMVSFEGLTLRQLLETAVKMAFVHPGWSFVMLFLAIIPFMVSLIVPAAAFVLATFSAFALIVSWASWRVIHQYVMEEPTVATSETEPIA